MNWLNYHHLLYFWTVAREGTIARACEKLLLAQPTISAQLKKLERSLGHKLFRRVGRQLELTDMGHVVFRYADEIFRLGQELNSAVQGQPVGRPQRIVIGVADVLPKMIAFDLITPALAIPGGVHIVCRESRADRLLAELALHELDVVLSDAPAPPSVKVRAFSHFLGECPITVFGAETLATTHRRKFPQSLKGAPFLVPSSNTAVRHALDQWLTDNSIRPNIVGEFDDSALMKAFGQAGVGLFIGPSVIEEEIRRQYGVRIVGRLPDVQTRFFAISTERRLTHPAVVAISEAASRRLTSRLARRTNLPARTE